MSKEIDNIKEEMSKAHSKVWEATHMVLADEVDAQLIYGTVWNGAREKISSDVDVVFRILRRELKDESNG